MRRPFAGRSGSIGDNVDWKVVSVLVSTLSSVEVELTGSCCWAGTSRDRQASPTRRKYARCGVRHTCLMPCSTAGSPAEHRLTGAKVRRTLVLTLSEVWSKNRQSMRLRAVVSLTQRWMAAWSCSFDCRKHDSDAPSTSTLPRYADSSSYYSFSFPYRVLLPTP